MAITVSNIQTLFNTYIGDSSTDRVTAAERLNLITEACVWLNEELQNEHAMATYNLEYIEGLNRYKITTAMADLLVGADLRRKKELQYNAFTRKSSREIWEDIAQNSYESAWAVERYDDEAYIVINHKSEHPRIVIDNFDSITSDGTWTADATGSDALNLTLDLNEMTEGTASLNFDVDVSQSGNNLATVYVPDKGAKDLSDQEDLGYFTFDVYIPDVTEVTSIRLRFSSDTSGTPSTISNYWSGTVTTDSDGEAFANGFNTISIPWSSLTMTGTPDASAIVYWQFDINYGAGQADDTDFRIDNFAITRPERLVFHYVSFYVGTSSGGTDLFTFTATTDIPFFSGKYDQYKYAVAHKAASIAFYSILRLQTEATVEESEALKALQRYRKTFETSVVRETRNFKVLGNNLRRRGRSRIRFI